MLRRPTATLLSPEFALAFARGGAVPLAVVACALLALGAVWGLALSPPDYRQGETIRILYVHVPAAWMSLLCWLGLAVLGFGTLVRRCPVLGLAFEAVAWSGLWFTALALATGSLWGRPVWGLWWAWDARLTSELILLFLYLAALALTSAFAERERGQRAAGVLAIAGLLHLPIIKFSVAWWTSLHQGSSIFTAPERRLPSEFLHPLLVMGLAYFVFTAALTLMRLETGILERGLVATTAKPRRQALAETGEAQPPSAP